MIFKLLLLGFCGAAGLSAGTVLAAEDVHAGGTADFVVRVLQIILIDVVLSGDNAVVIALAAHRLPEHQRRNAILWGGGIAILLRIIFTMIMSFLLVIPGISFVGGLVLVYIACKLLLDENEGEGGLELDGARKSMWAAIRMITAADFVMSLDNMLAVAGASHGNWLLLLFGLVISIAIIMTCSNVVAWLMNKYRWIVYVGAGILAYTAGDMMINDRELAGAIVRKGHVVLSHRWVKDWMESAETIRTPAEGALPPELERLVHERPKRSSGPRQLVFIGQMSEEQRDILLNYYPHEPRAIEELYERARHQEPPAWVPAAWQPFVTRQLQRKWPAEMYFATENRHHYYVEWIFLTAVVVACLLTPRWLRRKPPAASAEPVPST